MHELAGVQLDARAQFLLQYFNSQATSPSPALSMSSMPPWYSLVVQIVPSLMVETKALMENSGTSNLSSSRSTLHGSVVDA